MAAGEVQERVVVNVIECIQAPTQAVGVTLDIATGSWIISPVIVVVEPRLMVFQHLGRCQSAKALTDPSSVIRNVISETTLGKPRFSDLHKFGVFGFCFLLNRIITCNG